MSSESEKTPVEEFKERAEKTNQPTQNQEKKSTVGQEQIHNILFNRDIGWKEIIYDLINTEQLDPWDINITILSDKYLEKIEELEEADFFVSSKVLFAASLLLRIKSEMLLSRYIKSIDEILFGKKEEKKKYQMEKIEMEDEIPELVPKTPIPRVKKVTLNELMDSLNKAINTENRRIKKAIVNKNALRETGISLPKKRNSIKDRIKEIYNKLTNIFKLKKEHKNIPFTEFVGEKSSNKKLEHFFPLLHLENQQEIWLAQEKHFGEIDIWEKKDYLKHHGDPFADLKIPENETEEESKDKKSTKEQSKTKKKSNKKEKSQSKDKN